VFFEVGIETLKKATLTSLEKGPDPKPLEIHGKAATVWPWLWTRSLFSKNVA